MALSFGPCLAGGVGLAVGLQGIAQQQVGDSRLIVQGQAGAQAGDRFRPARQRGQHLALHHVAVGGFGDGQGLFCRLQAVFRVVERGVGMSHDHVGVAFMRGQDLCLLQLRQGRGRLLIPVEQDFC